MQYLVEFILPDDSVEEAGEEEEEEEEEGEEEVKEKEDRGNSVGGNCTFNSMISQTHPYILHREGPRLNLPTSDDHNYIIPCS